MKMSSNLIATLKHTTDNLIQLRTKMDDRTILRNNKPAANTGFASGGMTCKLGVLCFYQSLCLVDNEVLRNRHLRVAAKR